MDRYLFIVDPLTQKRINIWTKKGREILEKYIIYKRGGNKNKIIAESGVYAPKTYFEGLTEEETKKRIKRIREGSKSDHKDPKSYRDFETDFRNNKRIQTKPSGYTKQWKKHFPKAKSLLDKSKVTGVPIDIIEKIYNKGLAAWRTGHRPGATGQQWGYARVHSFLVKGKTFWTADRKLAIEAIDRSHKAQDWFDSIDGLCDTELNRDKNKWCVKRKICDKMPCK